MPTGHYYPHYGSDGVLADHNLSDGLIPGGVWQNLYEQSATQNFPIGTRLQLHDRVFYYALACGTTAVAMKAGHNDGAESAYNTDAVAYAAGHVGTIRVLDTNTRAVHYFQNGYLWIMNLVSGIYQLLKIKDSALGTAAHVDLTLYDPLPFEVPASTFTCIHRNPFASVSFTNSTGKAMIGVPLIPVTTACYFWIQTWGPCFGTAFNAVPGAVASDREVYFNSDGALIAGNETVLETVVPQRAGFIISNTEGGGD